MDNSSMDATPGVTEQPAQEQSVQAAQANERLFKQSELNEIVGRAKHDAVETFKRQQAQQGQQQSNAPAQQQYSNRALSEDDVRRLTSEELTRQREDWERQTLERQHADAAQKIVNSYKDKISAGKDKYQDFETVTGSVDMRYYPNVVQLLAEHVDNAHDILYDLAQNRYKLNNLEAICERTPQDAIYEIRRLSDSIKANESVSQMKTSNAPLSQQKPSAGLDSGVLSIRDLKMKYRV